MTDLIGVSFTTLLTLHVVNSFALTSFRCRACLLFLLLSVWGFTVLKRIFSAYFIVSSIDSFSRRSGSSRWLTNDFLSKFVFRRLFID